MKGLALDTAPVQPSMTGAKFSLLARTKLSAHLGMTAANCSPLTRWIRRTPIVTKGFVLFRLNVLFSSNDLFSTWELKL